MGKCTVLVVEDEDSTRMQLARVIRKEGYDVIEAENGQAGLEIFGKKLPDIVVTDIKMPNIDGLEMIHHMRRISSHVQIILITAYGETETVISALRQGVIDYLKKPLDLDLLCLALGRAQEKVNEHQRLVWVPALLLAEDEQATRDRLARVLEKENWKVFRAADGDEAVNIFAENKIDIVLLDIRMPRKDGLQTLKEMKALSSDFQAIVFSGYGDEKTAIDAMRNGAINFLRKPIDLDQLIVSVEKAFERLNTERAIKYRTRELELTKQIVAKITEEKEIILDFRTMPGIPAMNFAKSILDNVPGGLVVLNRDLNILYMNHCVARIFGATPNKIDLEFVSKLSEFGITDLTYEMFISAFEQLINSTSGTLETIKTGKYSYMTLLRLKIMGEIQDHAIILITMRGERK